jgi:hypothetical protein
VHKQPAEGADGVVRTIAGADAENQVFNNGFNVGGFQAGNLHAFS